MFFKELTALIIYGQQLFLALCGAACLWGLFFSVNAENAQDEGKKNIFDRIASKLFIPFSFGFVGAASLWLLRVFSHSSFASHRFAKIFSDLSVISQYSQRSIPMLWAVFIIVSLLAIGCFVFWKKQFPFFIRAFYLLNFIIVFILISFPTGLAGFDNGHLFFITHGFPLIFTIGTVTIVDFLFYFTRGSLRAKRLIFPYFPTLNKFIWIGLGIHFFTDWVVAGQIVLSSQFYFIQVVTAIIIINGMLFTGPLTETLISGVSERRVKPLDRKWGIISSISGVISFSSWTTLMLATLAPSIPFGFWPLFIFYVIKTALVYLAFLFIEWLTDIPMSFVNTN